MRNAHPIVSAYGRMRRAELLAAHGETREAQRALSVAEAATEAADGIEPPASMYWWSTGFGAVQRGGVLALLRRTAEAVAEATHGLAAMPTEHRESEWPASALRRIDPDMSGT
ncbi:hypothetical protein [Nocardia arthritidis]|uniref:hypothetical protein n=1 Tax=Nocardia arthritidis TaxID=228602 RepID=UPI000A426D3C|nr:hypothetical protein [Nocardia arthritidis]